jgi:hypothetical protein
VKAYSLRGSEIAELAGGEFSAGKHSLEFASHGLPSGLCLIKMESGAFSATRPLLIGAK